MELEFLSVFEINKKDPARETFPLKELCLFGLINTMYGDEYSAASFLTHLSMEYFLSFLLTFVIYNRTNVFDKE
jgi:hypothetical protein